MLKILVSDSISEYGLKKLLDADDVKVDIITNLDQKGLIEIIDDYDGLMVRSNTKVTKEVIDAANNLKVIGRAGVGVDNIDVKAASEKGIVVINAPDGNTISTAEHSFAMLMALARWIPQADHDLKQGLWNRNKFIGVELNGKTLGIIGMGRIGTEVAKRAKAFNMNIVAYDPYITEQRAKVLGVRLGTVEEVVKDADFLTVHTPLTKETQYIIDDEQFAAMKKGVRIINCARGGIIREEALLRALNDGIVDAAALDVYEQEPPQNNSLVNHSNVITTPHLGASTKEAQLNVAIDVAEEVYNYLSGVPYKNTVNLPSLSFENLNHVKPYLSLAEKLGILIANYTDGAIERIEIKFGGDIADKEINVLSRTVLKGILSQHLGSSGQVNDVNAPILAKGRGIDVVESKSSSSYGFINLLTVIVKTKDGEKFVSGTALNGYGARIVNLNGFTVDLIPDGNLILMDHIDQPGIIGKVGSLLGDNRVNIATMQVGRNNVGGQAIAFLRVDSLVDENVLKELEQINGVQNICQVEL